MWVARLCDVDPDRRSLNLRDGILRIDSDAGEPHEIEIDLWSTSNVFLAGHRLRVQITTAASRDGTAASTRATSAAPSSSPRTSSSATTLAVRRTSSCRFVPVRWRPEVAQIRLVGGIGCPAPA